MVKKKKLAEYFSARSCDSHFYVKGKFLYVFPQKLFKTRERHSLAVYGSISGEKKFLFIFIPFYWFEKKSCLNKSKFSSGFAPFKHGQKNKLSEYFSARF